MYLQGPDIKTLILKLQSTFPGSELIAEVCRLWVAKRMQGGLFKRQFQKEYSTDDNVTFNWGIKTGDELENWNPELKFLNEWFYYEYSEKKLGRMKYMRYIPKLAKAQWVIHYKLGNP
ncbi:MAG: hypothetical protein ACFFBD_14625 [Candidatus Hodarchaeota archaeon]